MKPKKALKGTYVLVAEKDQNTLETLVKSFSNCLLDTASSSSEAKRLLQQNHYDMAILGVGTNGRELREIVGKKKIPTVMLADNESPKNESAPADEKDIVYHVSKNRMAEINELASGVFFETEKKKNPWEKYLMRSYRMLYNRMFHGQKWREQKNEFLDNLIKRIF